MYGYHIMICVIYILVQLLEKNYRFIGKTIVFLDCAATLIVCDGHDVRHTHTHTNYIVEENI